MATHLEQLVHWERSGGIWRVLGRSPNHVTVGLFSCDGGTEMSRLTGRRDELDGFLGCRTSNEGSTVDEVAPGGPDRVIEGERW